MYVVGSRCFYVVRLIFNMMAKKHLFAYVSFNQRRRDRFKKMSSMKMFLHRDANLPRLLGFLKDFCSSRGIQDFLYPIWTLPRYTFSFSDTSDLCASFIFVLPLLILVPVRLAWRKCQFCFFYDPLRPAQDRIPNAQIGNGDLHAESSSGSTREFTLNGRDLSGCCLHVTEPICRYRLSGAGSLASEASLCNQGNCVQLHLLHEPPCTVCFLAVCITRLKTRDH